MGVNIYIPDENKIVHNTEVDFSKRIANRDVHLVQYDSVIPIIAVHLYLNSEEYIIPVDETNAMKLRWGKNLTQFVHKDILGCNEARNIAYISIDSDMTNEYGEYNPIIELIAPINNIVDKIGSSPFKVIINRNPIQEEE